MKLIFKLQQSHSLCRHMENIVYRVVHWPGLEWDAPCVPLSNSHCPVVHASCQPFWATVRIYRGRRTDPSVPQASRRCGCCRAEVILCLGWCSNSGLCLVGQPGDVCAQFHWLHSRQCPPQWYWNLAQVGPWDPPERLPVAGKKRHPPLNKPKTI